MSYKVLRNIEIDLGDPASFARAAAELEFLAEQIDSSMEELVTEMGEEGAKLAKEEVASYDAVDTGELERSITCTSFDRGERAVNVMATAKHAAYVEYGTGPVGKENTHPEYQQAGWEYDVGKTIHHRVVEWVNPRTGETVYNDYGRGWWYPGDDGQWHWTHGQPSRAFMYSTMMMLEDMAPELGAKILNQM